MSHRPPASMTAQVAEPASIKFRWLTQGLAAAITVVMHVMLIGSALLGTPGRPPLKPLNEGAPASDPNSNATEFVTTLLLLNDRSITPQDRPIDESAYAASTVETAVPKELALTTLDEPKPPEISGSDTGTDETSPTAEAMGDAAGRAMLFGRYMGQIKARIERGWEHPVLLAESFECLVQIKQNHRGEVQEVTLQRCADDPAWQVSLVQAIQRASPLSAPPNESVFTDVVTLNFSAPPVEGP